MTTEAGRRRAITMLIVVGLCSAVALVVLVLVETDVSHQNKGDDTRCGKYLLMDRQHKVEVARTVLEDSDASGKELAAALGSITANCLGTAGDGYPDTTIGAATN